MNIYQVTIDNEAWSVVATRLTSAIRQVINSEENDRRKNDFWKLDREIRDHPIKITIELLSRNATEEEMKEFFGDSSVEE